MSIRRRDIRKGFDALSRRLREVEDNPDTIPAWGNVSPESGKIRFPDRTEEYYDKSLFPWMYFPGMIYYRRGVGYILEKGNEADLGARELREEKLVRTCPIVKVELEKFDVEESQKVKWEKEIVIEKGRYRAKLSLKGRVNFEDYDWEKRGTVEYGDNNSVDRMGRGLRIKTEFGKEMEHLFYNFLPHFFKDPFRFVYLASDEDYLYVLPHCYEKEEFVEEFYLRAGTYLKELISMGYEMLYECPCKEGCAMCLYYAYHPENPEKTELRKKEFLEYLAEFLGKREKELAGAKVAFREGELREGELLQEYYELIKEKVLRIFEEHFDLKIKDPALIKATGDLEEGVAGQYVPNENLVKVRP